MRVVFGNSYPMTVARQRVLEGTYPANHLWGADHLEQAGIVVEYVDPPAGRRSRLASLELQLFGDLRVQAAMLRHAHRGDVIYVGTHTIARSLYRLRRLHLLGHPTVAVVHGVPDRPAPTERTGGIDVVITLSAFAHQRLLEAGRDPSRTFAARWGPDLACPWYAATSTPPGEPTFVCSGKTQRDIATLGRSLIGTSFRGIVHAAAPDGDVPDTVRFAPEAREPEIIDDLRAASVVAIPLATTALPFGLTELNHALALGKAVIMTRNPNIDVDIESEGFGLWVDLGDVEGWRHAMSTLLTDADRLAEMGRKARRFAEAGWNTSTFGPVVVAAVNRALQGS